MDFVSMPWIHFKSLIFPTNVEFNAVPRVLTALPDWHQHTPYCNPRSWLNNNKQTVTLLLTELMSLPFCACPGCCSLLVPAYA